MLRWPVESGRRWACTDAERGPWVLDTEGGAEGAKLRMRGRGCLLDESWELADAFRALAVRKTCPSPRAWHGTEDARESCACPGERWEAAVNRLWAWTVPTFMTPVVPLALVGHTSAPSLVWDTRHGIAIDAVRRDIERVACGRALQPRRERALC